MQHPFRQEKSIFDGQFLLITEDNEFRMSLWVKGFGIHSANGEEVLPLESSFNLIRYEESGNSLIVHFDVYPNGRKQYDAEINLFNRMFTYDKQTMGLDKFVGTFMSIQD